MSLPSGRYRIVHQASSNLVTIPNGRHNTGITLAPYNNSATQTWDVTAVGNEEYTIKSAAFPTVFASHPGIAEGAGLTGSTISMRWVLTTEDNAYYTIETLALANGYRWYGNGPGQLTIWAVSHPVDNRYRFQFLPV